MKVSDVPAGRELDALVSQHVRGECLHDPGQGNITRIGSRHEEYQCRRCGAVLDENDYLADAYDPWTPSENASQALELWVELARRLGRLCILEEEMPGRWVASYRLNDETTGRGSGGTAALAICRGMLAAVGVTDGSS